MPSCCLSPANWTAKPHPQIKGWEIVTCKRCGRWIGNKDPKRRENQKQ